MPRSRRVTATGLSGRAVSVAVAGLLLAGCASGADTPSASSASTSSEASETASASASPSATSISPTPEPPDAVEIAITVKDGTVTPPPRRVKVTQGETVRLTVTADVREEVHVHGFDVSKEVRPGRPATLEFVADQQGVFEVELEHAALQLVQLQVR